MASSTSRLATFSPPVFVLSFFWATPVQKPPPPLPPPPPPSHHPPPPPPRPGGRRVADIRSGGGFDVEHGAARRPRLADLVAGAEHCGCRCNLRLAVEVPEAHLGQAALQLLQDCNRHDRRPVVELGQAAEVSLREER